MKIKINEQQLKHIISEKIRDYEGYNELSSLMTIINKKRGVGFISSDLTKLKSLIGDNPDIHLLKVERKDNTHAYIVYRDGYQNDVNELLEIAKKYNGYLSYKATKEDAIRIGQLLGYEDEDILNYVEKKYK